MNYHNITTDDMLNGDGLRVVLWVSGCTMECYNCQNPQTWDFNSGIPFTDEAMQEILDCLSKPYISGVTLSGGHPLEPENIETVAVIVRTVKEKFLQKTIWLYTGYTWEDIYGTISCLKNPVKYSYIFTQEDYLLNEIISLVDIIVDGRYIDERRDITLPFRGSSNQRIIDVQQSIKQDKVVIYTNE